VSARSVRLCLGAFALAILLGGFTHFFLLPLGDSDRFYHLALSRMLAEHGSLHLTALPQVDDLGWGDYFPDKEFLAHAFGALAYRIGGEPGIAFLFFLAAAGTAWTLFAYAATLLSPGLAFLAVLPWFFSTGFLFRILFLRPYVFAIFAFTLMNVALLRRRAWLIAVAGAFYSLSYHALYLPFAALALFAVCAFGEPDRAVRWKLAGWGVLGLAVGTVLNPYFPSNLTALWQQLVGNFLAQHSLSGVRFGAEVYALSAPLFFKLYALPITALLPAIFLLGRGRDPELRYLTALSLLFLCVSFQSARGGEYMVPALALLAITASARLSFEPRRLALALGVLSLLQAGLLFSEWSSQGAENPDASLNRENLEALLLPARGTKIFNCDWAQGAFILYDRPDLRFVDVLDPLSLYFHDNARFLLREALRSGNVGGAAEVLRTDFHAAYVFCREGRLTEQLSQDPRVKLLYPPLGQNSSLRLFALGTEGDSAFVHDWGVRPPRSAAGALSFDLTEKSEPAEILHHSDSSFLKLTLGSSYQCVHLSLAKVEIARHAGAAYLAIGGGPAMRAWRNGKSLFASGRGYPLPKSTQALVLLDPPLKANDHLDFLYCGGGDTYYGAEVSFYTREGLAKLCDSRRIGPKKPAESWLTTDQVTCLGPLAHPAPDSAIRF
jgi:hypothetical protein